MEKKMEGTRMGYIGKTMKIHFSSMRILPRMEKQIETNLEHEMATTI